MSSAGTIMSTSWTDPWSSRLSSKFRAEVCAACNLKTIKRNSDAMSPVIMGAYKDGSPRDVWGVKSPNPSGVAGSTWVSLLQGSSRIRVDRHLGSATVHKALHSGFLDALQNRIAIAIFYYIFILWHLWSPTVTFIALSITR